MRNPFKRPVIMLAAFALMTTFGLGLLGCDSSSPGGDSAAADTGEVIIGLTDAPGDFVTYTVDVSSVTLTKANGAVVETLPISTTVDFTQYMDMTEFLTAATVPAGAYREVAMTLDYANADIQVENEAGAPVAVDAILDESGTPVARITLTLSFGDADYLVIAPGIPAHMTLDFDLAASNAVAFDDQGDPALTVYPVLKADIDPETPKLHRLRGPLKSVSLEDDMFTVIIRPFKHTLKRDGERFGNMPVTVDSETVYDIDGQAFQGQAGLAALAQVDEMTGVVVTGDLALGPRRSEAREVRAGTSVEGGDLDVLTGHVISVGESRIVMSGAAFMRYGQRRALNKDITVFWGEQTAVRREFSADRCNIEDIGVGQRLTVFGRLSKSDGLPDAMDASEGHAVMMLTHVGGDVVSVDTVSADESPLEMDLARIDGRQPDIFEFEAWVNPENLAIHTGTLDLSRLNRGEPIKLSGFFTPADEADFSAQTILDVTDAAAGMHIAWRPPVQTPFTAISDTGLTLDLTGADRLHHVRRTSVAVDLTDLADPPMIVPKTGGAGRFAIIARGPVQVFDAFSDFTVGLENELADGSSVRQIFAHGSYDDASATLTAERINVHLR